MTYIEKFWRDATAADVARVMNGETVEARFRDYANCEWGESSTLKGWQGHIPYKWIKATGAPYCECQVYAPPQWFLDKPDPGDEYRLLGKSPDEPVQGGDFIRNTSGGWTELANGCNPAQAEGVWYRRKIDRLLPEHRWLIHGDRLESGDLYFDKGAVVEVNHEYWGNKVVISEAFMRRIEPPKPEPKHYVLRVGDTADTPSGHRIKITEHGIEVS